MVVLLLQYFDTWFFILCLLLWLVVFFCFMGPILVCMSGEQNQSVIDSPSHMNYDSNTVSRIRSKKARHKEINESIKY